MSRPWAKTNEIKTERVDEVYSTANVTNMWKIYRAIQNLERENNSVHQELERNTNSLNETNKNVEELKKQIDNIPGMDPEGNYEFNSVTTGTLKPPEGESYVTIQGDLVVDGSMVGDTWKLTSTEDRPTIDMVKHGTTRSVNESSSNSKDESIPKETYGLSKVTTFTSSASSTRSTSTPTSMPKPTKPKLDVTTIMNNTNPGTSTTISESTTINDTVTLNTDRLTISSGDTDLSFVGVTDGYVVGVNDVGLIGLGKGRVDFGYNPVYVENISIAKNSIQNVISSTSPAIPTDASIMTSLKVKNFVDEAIKAAGTGGESGGGSGGDVDLTNYYTKDETYSRGEVDAKLNDKANTADVYPKSETYSKDETYAKTETYSRGEIDTKLDDLVIGGGGEVNLNNYYTKEEVDGKLTTKADAANVYPKSETYAKTETYSKEETYPKTELYTKTEVDAKLEEISTGGGSGGDLSNYYNKGEIDAKLEGYYDKVNSIVMGEGGGIREEEQEIVTSEEKKPGFIAVANTGTQRCVTSVDGKIWTEQLSLDSASGWTSVCLGMVEGKEFYVAVAWKGEKRNAYSTDGMNWTLDSNLDIASGWYSVTYGEVGGKGTFVAVAGTGDNRCAYSEDGKTWTVGNSIGTTSYWRNVQYAVVDGDGSSGSGIFVAVADTGDNRCAYSEDGKTWTVGNSIGSEGGWYSVAYGEVEGGKKFVAVGNGGSKKNAYSTDGKTWTVGTSLSASNYWRSVTYGKIDGKGAFVAVASGANGVAYSMNGVDWTAGSGLSTGYWRSVTYGEIDGTGIFATVSDGATAGFAYSNDGKTWTGGSIPNSQWQCIYFGVIITRETENVTVQVPEPGVTLGLNDESKGELKLNGCVVTELYSKTETDEKFYGKGSPVVLGEGGDIKEKGIFVAVGYSGTNSYAEDGITWTSGNSTDSNDKWTSMCYGNGKFVAVAISGTNLNAYSTNGINWTSGNSTDGNGSWTSVCYGNGKFVAVAWNGPNRNAYSTNGINWTSSNSIDGNNKWISVCYGNGKFVAVAISGTNLNAYSTDGINWTTGNSIDGNGSWTSVCYGNGKFVAVGTNCNAYSTDGINWTSGNSIDGSDWQFVCYGNGKFVAVASGGTNRNAYSTDGITWTSGNSIDGNSTWWSMCYGNGKFVAVAKDGTNRNAYSEDGINWTSGNSIESGSSWYGVCFGTPPTPTNGITLKLNDDTSAGELWLNGKDLSTIDLTDYYNKTELQEYLSTVITETSGTNDYNLLNNKPITERGSGTWLGYQLTRTGDGKKFCLYVGATTDKVGCVIYDPTDNHFSLGLLNGGDNEMLKFNNDNTCTFTTNVTAPNMYTKTEVDQKITSGTGLLIKGADTDGTPEQINAEINKTSNGFAKMFKSNYNGNYQMQTIFTVKLDTSRQFSLMFPKSSNLFRFQTEPNGTWHTIQAASSSQTITHEAPYTGDISNYSIGKPVFATGNVCKYSVNSSEWLTDTGPTDCICEIKPEGSYNEFVGICVGFNEETKSVIFATHGDYYVNVVDSSKYTIGDLITYDGEVVGDGTPITGKIMKMSVGKVTSIVNGDTVAVLKD